MTKIKKSMGHGAESKEQRAKSEEQRKNALNVSKKKQGAWGRGRGREMSQMPQFP
jgi:hypothetical protein